MDRLEQYIEEHSLPEDPLLTELDRQTNLRVIQPKMVSGRVQGAFLKMIVEMLRPRTVLEIGTFTGYSALAMAAGLEDGAELHTVEVDDELEDIARSYFHRSPHGAKIHLHIGPALEVVPSLERTFDLVYIDGDKREYPAYYRMLLERQRPQRINFPPLVRSGTVILADNVLWYGKVAEDVKDSDRMSHGILEFNRIVANDARVENVILPLRDGINMIRVK